MPESSDLSDQSDQSDQSVLDRYSGLVSKMCSATVQNVWVP